MHDCDIQIPFHRYESLFNILIYIIKFVVAIQYAYDLNVFAKMYWETGENCAYKAIPDSVSCRVRAPTGILTILTSSQGNSPHQLLSLAVTKIRNKGKGEKKSARAKKKFGEQNEPRGRLRWERVVSLADIFPNE